MAMNRQSAGGVWRDAQGVMAPLRAVLVCWACAALLLLPGCDGKGLLQEPVGCTGPTACPCCQTRACCQNTTEARHASDGRVVDDASELGSGNHMHSAGIAKLVARSKGNGRRLLQEGASSGGFMERDVGSVQSQLIAKLVAAGLVNTDNTSVLEMALAVRIYLYGV